MATGTTLLRATDIDDLEREYSLSRLDAVEWLKAMPSSSVDLVVTDPPYESLEKHRAIGTTTRLKNSKSSSNEWFKIFPNDRFRELFEEIFRVLAPNSHFYLFCDAETSYFAKPIAEQVGFKFWKPLIWDKRKIGMGYHYRARYEFILFFEKGKRKLASLSTPDIIQADRILRGYPTQKPVEVSDILVSQSSSEGQLVIDPFCGSGTFGVSALAANRRFAGNDINPEAIEISASRLEATKLGIREIVPLRNNIKIAAPATTLELF